MFVKFDRFNYQRKSALLDNRVETITLNRGDEVTSSSIGTADFERGKALGAFAETYEEAMGQAPRPGSLGPNGEAVFAGPEANAFTGTEQTSSVLGSDAAALAIAGEARTGTLEARIAGLKAGAGVAPTDASPSGIKNPGAPVNPDDTNPDTIEQALARSAGLPIEEPTTVSPYPPAPPSVSGGTTPEGTTPPAPPTSDKPDDELRAMTVEQVHAHVGQFPGDRARLLALENEREKPRTTVLAIADDPS